MFVFQLKQLNQGKHSKKNEDEAGYYWNFSNKAVRCIKDRRDHVIEWRNHSAYGRNAKIVLCKNQLECKSFEDDDDWNHLHEQREKSEYYIVLSQKDYEEVDANFC